MQLPTMFTLTSALTTMHQMHQSRMADAANADAVTLARRKKAAHKAALRRLDDLEEDLTFEMLVLLWDR
jgi:hypothetical protein